MSGATGQQRRPSRSGPPRSLVSSGAGGGGGGGGGEGEGE